MKFLAAITFVGCIALAVDAGLTEEHIEEIKKANMECIKETGISDEVVAKADKGEFEDDEKLSVFYFCFFQKPGFINAAGEFQNDVIFKKLSEIYGDDLGKSVTEKCTKDNHGNGPENAMYFSKCATEELKDVE